MPADDRRAMLIDAALPLLARHGQAVTTAEVARAAGVAEGTLFRVFPDKDSLIDACLERAMAPAPTLRAVRAAAAHDDVVASVTAAASAIVAHFRSALPVMHGVMQQGAPRPNAAAVIGGMFGALLGGLGGLLADHVRRGELRGDPDQLARILVGMCQAAVWQYWFDAGHTVAVDTFVGVFLDGCRG
jgi:AcrR family transcriptional regulator